MEHYPNYMLIQKTSISKFKIKIRIIWILKYEINHKENRQIQKYVKHASVKPMSQREIKNYLETNEKGSKPTKVYGTQQKQF